MFHKRNPLEMGATRRPLPDLPIRTASAHVREKTVITTTKKYSTRQLRRTKVEIIAKSAATHVAPIMMRKKVGIQFSGQQ